MKFKLYNISLILGLITTLNAQSQDKNEKPIEYNIIAEGVDSPIPKLQIVCFNKFFNESYLPVYFRNKYKLNEKSLYKKKMLVEIFESRLDQGLDKIKLNGIKENDKEVIIDYDIINDDSSNDNKRLSPFVIIQIPKSKKTIKFIANGIPLEEDEKIYVNQ